MWRVTDCVLLSERMSRKGDSHVYLQTTCSQCCDAVVRRGLFYRTGYGYSRISEEVHFDGGVGGSSALSSQKCMMAQGAPSGKSDPRPMDPRRTEVS